jgi:PTH1 family peptidyl-tRNA hydrolase
VILLGLGNPGTEYEWTRHNAGYLVAQAAQERWGKGTWRKRPLFEEALLRFRGREHRTVRPTTFMNCSGEAVTQLLREGAARSDVLVILDDVYLPFGKLRIRASGGDGGHNGLESVIEALGSEQVARMRLGVGRPSDAGEMVDHVLGGFDPVERERLPQLIDRALEALKMILSVGIEKTMSRFNALPPPWEEPATEVEPEGTAETSDEVRKKGN